MEKPYFKKPKPKKEPKSVSAVEPPSLSASLQKNKDKLYMINPYEIDNLASWPKLE